MSKNTKRTIALALFAGAAIILSVGTGSVYVSPAEVLSALFGKGGDENIRSLILELRLPRVTLAFLTGAALSVGGTVMQSALGNPLASPFGLGVSAGAGLGVTAVIVSGVTGGVLGAFLLPAAGFAGGIVTALLVMALARAMDARLSTATIVLTGMVTSLFFSAVMDLLATLSPAYAQRIGLWQLGSFSAKGWQGVAVLAPVLLICLALFFRRASELDIMTFGDEQAQAIGVDPRRTRRALVVLTAILTGSAVAFSGIIGFIDLIAPHAARKLFGAEHRRALPAAAVLGGSFMTLCDLAARTVASPREIPVGAVTALIGAPFFLYIFFRKRSK